MTIVQKPDLNQWIIDALQALGMRAEDAARVADVYVRATLRGVGHHDIYDLPGRMRSLQNKNIDPRPELQLVSKYEALECYEGNNGLGELCCSFMVEQAVELAARFGVGFCTIRGSNHFLSAAPYVEKAAEQGYLALVFTRTIPTMSAPGTNTPTIGNNPMGYGVQSGGEAPLVLDIAMAYTSYGKINEYINKGEPVPAHWGKDENGQPTTDPKAMRDRGTIAPMAEHKGFGLALLMEVLTGVMSGGQVIGETHPEYGKNGDTSHSAIVLKTDAFVPQAAFQARMAEMLGLVQIRDEAIQIPGERSYKRKRDMESGGIPLQGKLLAELSQWADTLQIKPLVTSSQG
jgi:LDH2 family malate/lactate/ureidoglycolate dehydrogenase